MKISILIPVNNFDIVALVHSIKDGMTKVNEFTEILIGDDGSSDEYKRLYQSIEEVNVRVVASEKNIGRAAIRNKLISESKGDMLLFIDADTMMYGTSSTFLSNWLGYARANKVICGGILYKENPPGDPDKFLRWKYGRKKEQRKASDRNKNPYASFSTFNVLIDRSVFSKIRFYEELKQYGHEDTLFGYQLKKAGINILHIDNGLVHEGLETNREYLSKTKNSIENLSRLYDNVTDKGTFSTTVALVRLYRWLSIFRLTGLLAGFFIKYREKMEIRLDSSKASLALFKLYKISMFCTYREIHGRKKFLPIFKIPPDII